MTPMDNSTPRLSMAAEKISPPSILDLEASPSIASVETSQPVDDRLEKLSAEYGVGPPKLQFFLPLTLSVDMAFAI